jgi:hypothetical protein
MIKLIRDEIVQVFQSNISMISDLLAIGINENDPDIAEIAALAKQTPGQVILRARENLVDFSVAAEIAKSGKTILFDHRQALALRPAMRRFTEKPFWKLPFTNTIIQFDRAIAEREFFDYEPNRLQSQDDPVIALLLSEEQGVRNAVAVFVSGDVQRAKWVGDKVVMPEDLLYPEDTPSQEAMRNKRQLQLLAQACCLYMSCKNIEIEKYEEFSRAERRKAQKKGVALPDYYTPVVVRRVTKYHYADKNQQEQDEREGATHSGGEHSYRYDVSQHFRALANGDTIIVQNHERGLKHERKPEVVQKVPYTPQDPRIGGARHERTN